MCSSKLLTSGTCTCLILYGIVENFLVPHHTVVVETCACCAVLGICEANVLIWLQFSQASAWLTQDSV
jgi:hypothetical protein